MASIDTHGIEYNRILGDLDKLRTYFKTRIHEHLTICVGKVFKRGKNYVRIKIGHYGVTLFVYELQSYVTYTRTVRKRLVKYIKQRRFERSHQQNFQKDDSFFESGDSSDSGL